MTFVDPETRRSITNDYVDDGNLLCIYSLETNKLSGVEGIYFLYFPLLTFTIGSLFVYFHQPMILNLFAFIILELTLIFSLQNVMSKKIGMLLGFFLLLYITIFYIFFNGIRGQSDFWVIMSLGLVLVGFFALGAVLSWNKIRIQYLQPWWRTGAALSFSIFILTFMIIILLQILTLNRVLVEPIERIRPYLDRSFLFRGFALVITILIVITHSVRDIFIRGQKLIPERSFILSYENNSGLISTLRIIGFQIWNTIRLAVYVILSFVKYFFKYLVENGKLLFKITWATFKEFFIQWFLPLGSAVIIIFQLQELTMFINDYIFMNKFGWSIFVNVLTLLVTVPVLIWSFANASKLTTYVTIVICNLVTSLGIYVLILVGVVLSYFLNVSLLKIDININKYLLYNGIVIIILAVLAFLFFKNKSPIDT